MNQFQRYQQTALYISAEEGTALNFFGYYLPEAATYPDTLSYADAWSTHIGLLLFVKSTPEEKDLKRLMDALQKTFPAGTLAHTSVAWATIGDDINFQQLLLQPDKEKGIVLSANFSVEILSASFLLAAVSPVTATLNESATLQGLTITYPPTAETSAPVPEKNVFIPITTDARGCILADIAQNDEQRGASVPQKGFYSFVSRPETPGNFQGCCYPLFAATQEDAPTVYTGYHMKYDPIDPYNPKRTKFTYAGFAYQIKKMDEPPYNQVEIVSGNALAKLSNFGSVFGAPVKLLPLTDTDHPAGYVLCELPPGYDMPYYMAPEGDFQVLTDTTTPNLAGGLSGTEFFTLTGTNILRFESAQPACVQRFPFVLASPVAAPSDALASPFSAAYYTSWATLYTPSAAAVPYVAQPAGASLYAKGKDESTGILDPTNIAFSFKADKKQFFPLFPYAGVTGGTQPQDMSLADITALEAIVISPQRRLAITKQSSTNAHLVNAAAAEIKYATTPGGILAKTTQSNDGTAVQWNQFLLGKNGMDEIAFNNPKEEVITAMQSSDVFLVVSNTEYLQGFANKVTIGDWQLTVNTGTNQRYGDYRNIIIFKGRKGKLYDPDNVANCLVANPKKWSQANDFSIPQTGGTPDSGQLVILSNWLQDYFRDGCAQTSDYFEKFRTIATSETWTGILFLRVDITDMPKNLSGIIAGVSDPSEFNAHHLGIEVSPVELSSAGIPELKKPSSFFGLIYYLDPGFKDTMPIKAIAPGSLTNYDFKLLALKVLFENTAVKGFESYAQLTLNQLFGCNVSRVYDPANLYRNVLLTGNLQITQGQPVYSLSSKNDDAFYLDNNIIHKVEITGAVLSSRSKANATQQESWFALNGYIDFNILKTPEGAVYDLFSFGNDSGQDSLRKGLNFANLGIRMLYNDKEPGKNNLSFDPEEIRFNPAPNVSTVRATGLYNQLQLGLENLVTAAEKKTPKDSGYLDIISDMPLAGPGNKGWYGLRLKLNMGTPGALAGNIGLNSYLLLSWSAESKGERYQAGLGIALPGSNGGGKMISLQTVLTLSIGQIRLTQAGDEGQKSFMLIFTDIALKFLGLLKLPPSGNTLFYLFGDPAAPGDKHALGWYAMYKQKQP
ncbi:hypothetical protein SAMN05444266_103163 [Chitinophaga jiangningensis]|uniref:Uncharacterized protein n=1 Tax=Chitinophaga jiangningensis TaxID=1419482 RepID=A0A1M7A7T4_9BACT|nr:hypothetical protein [Chitinophaga jiangningensis]SHL38787.1 hypothetical protein SAMN05444266_103163 [Chitinophaga jiangningensis]